MLNYRLTKNGGDKIEFQVLDLMRRAEPRGEFFVVAASVVAWQFLSSECTHIKTGSQWQFSPLQFANDTFKDEQQRQERFSVQPQENLRPIQLMMAIKTW